MAQLEPSCALWIVQPCQRSSNRNTRRGLPGMALHSPSFQLLLQAPIQEQVAEGTSLQSFPEEDSGTMVVGVGMEGGQLAYLSWVSMQTLSTRSLKKHSSAQSPNRPGPLRYLRHRPVEESQVQSKHLHRCFQALCYAHYPWIMEL